MSEMDILKEMTGFKYEFERKDGSRAFYALPGRLAAIQWAIDTIETLRKDLVEARTERARLQTKIYRTPDPSKPQTTLVYLDHRGTNTYGSLEDPNDVWHHGDPHLLSIRLPIPYWYKSRDKDWLHEFGGF